MEFGQAIASGFRQYATFRGRASRSEFWWWVLFSWLADVAAGIIDAGVGAHSGTGIIGGLVGLALLLPGLAVTVRRLHDTSHSGWWWWIGFTLIGLIPLMIWCCRRGDAAPNAYGVDPLDGSGGFGALPGAGPAAAPPSPPASSPASWGARRDL